MSLNPEKPYIYQKCDHIKRDKPRFEVDQALVTEIGTKFRVLPTFEKTMYDSVKTEFYSLERNKLMKCRWAEYKRQFEDRVFSPFLFPKTGDIHFYKCAVRFVPSESISPYANHRFSMTCGPGVDDKGHIPIPFELYMKRGRDH